MRPGERQVAPVLSGIRRDHVARYQWVAGQIKLGDHVIDVACGVGYGAKILADAGAIVTAIDCDEDAIEYAKAHYAHRNINYLVADANNLTHLAPHDAAVSFETIEHIEHPLPLLQALRCAPRLFASAPNETHFPFANSERRIAFHHRHYTRAQFQSLLTAAGFEITGWCGQAGMESDVEPNVSGRTIVVAAERRMGMLKVVENEMSRASAISAPPAHVVILGLGPSLESYVDIVKRMGSRRAFADEVWAINAAADVIQHDRVFHLDDVRIQEIRAVAKPQSNIAAMLTWLKTHPGPVYTSRAHDDYPGLVEFPLQDVINNLGYAYFNGTAAYAVAFAVHIGVKRISLFGCDFTLANAHHAERGRACMEYWLGFARARGIEICVAGNSSLMDACVPERDRLYGYDTVDVEIVEKGDDVVVSFTPRESLPTAAEIEARYDHLAHPNPLVQRAAG